MDISQEILSDITVFNKYAKYIPEKNRRETWKEICNRNLMMHVEKFPFMKEELVEIYDNYIIPKKILPSMRSMQFAGRPIDLSNSRIFNCAYLPMDHPFAFAELMFLLLGGTGTGYSVRKKHVEKLPPIVGPMEKQRRFLISDSIEGWADAVKVLIKAYTKGKSNPLFDFRDIRKKGARLITSGGKAPGPAPLRICLEHIREILDGAIGRKLCTIEVHDICCHIADAVLSGGIRRAAMIAGFDYDDMDMMSCKSGSWWELNPQRGRANNSVILKRGEVDIELFFKIWETIKQSGAGEPGFYWTDDDDSFTNPCGEIRLDPFQFCNLTEINGSDIKNQEEFNKRAEVASIIGTIQATYTDFHYLRPCWKDQTEKDFLIGVGITGIASKDFLDLDHVQAAKIVKETNEKYAGLLGIKPASRTTTVKPSGTSSLVVGSSSGIHAWHNDYYIRRMRIGKNESLYNYLLENFPDLIEDCVFKPHLEAVISFPQKAPDNAILRTESVFDFLDRIEHFNRNWVRVGSRNADKHNNVSCTVSLKDDDWGPVGEWMWTNREVYNGISVIPYNGGTYVQTPFEDCTEEKYLELMSHLKSIDLSKVIEIDDNTNLNDQIACAGGACLI